MVASRSNSFDCPIALFYQFPNLFGRLFEKNLTGERTVFPSIDVGHEKGERHQGARFVLSTIEEWHVSITFYPWKVTLNSFAIEDGLHFMTLAAQALSQVFLIRL